MVPRDGEEKQPVRPSRSTGRQKRDNERPKPDRWWLQISALRLADLDSIAHSSKQKPAGDALCLIVNYDANCI